MGRTARGVRGIRLRPNDKVVGMDIVVPGNNIFVISEFGYGKKTNIAQFTAHARGGVGIRSAVVNKKTGDLIGVTSLPEKGLQVIIISTQGQTIRLGMADIPELGRATQGVRIMRLNDGDTVASLALIDTRDNGDDNDEPKESDSKTKSKKSKNTKKPAKAKPKPKKK